MGKGKFFNFKRKMQSLTHKTWHSFTNKKKNSNKLYYFFYLFLSIVEICAQGKKIFTYECIKLYGKTKKKEKKEIENECLLCTRKKCRRIQQINIRKNKTRKNI